MALEIHNTGKTLTDGVDPTSSNVEYTYKGVQYPIEPCSFWYNTAAGTLFFCSANNGVTATWKKFTLL